MKMETEAFQDLWDTEDISKREINIAIQAYLGKR